MEDAVMPLSVANDMRELYARMTVDMLLNAGPKMFPNPYNPQCLEVILGGIVDGVKMFEAHAQQPLMDTFTAIALDYKEPVNE
jgi:hypothetical protein